MGVFDIILGSVTSWFFPKNQTVLILGPFTDLAMDHTETFIPRLKRAVTYETSFPNLDQGAFLPLPQDVKNTLNEQALIPLHELLQQTQDPSDGVEPEASHQRYKHEAFADSPNQLLHELHLHLDLDCPGLFYYHREYHLLPNPHHVPSQDQGVLICHKGPLTKEKDMKQDFWWAI